MIRPIEDNTLKTDEILPKCTLCVPFGNYP